MSSSTDALRKIRPEIKLSSARNYVKNAAKFIEIQETVPKEQVPRPTWEPGIEAGYRPPYKSWGHYFFSLLQLHNETINVWTHVIGCGVVLLYLYHYHVLLDFWNNERAWPFLIFILGSSMCMLSSAFAHLLHSKSAYIHYVAFSFDYAGAGLYCFGCMTFAFYYSYDEYFVKLFGPYGMPINACLSVISCFSCSYGKTKYSLHHVLRRKLWFIIPCGLHFILCIAPTGARFLKAVVMERRDMLPVEKESWGFHCMSSVAFLLAAMFFISHIPEVNRPGAFDNFCHSHQAWHILLVVTIALQFRSAHHDLQNRSYSKGAQDQLPYYRDVFMYFVAVCVADLAVIIFNRSLSERVVREEKQEICIPVEAFKTGKQRNVDNNAKGKKL